MKNNIFGKLNNFPFPEIIEREEIYNVIDWILIEANVEEK